MKQGLPGTIQATTFLGEDWAAAVLLHAPWHWRSKLLAEVQRQVAGAIGTIGRDCRA